MSDFTMIWDDLPEAAKLSYCVTQPPRFLRSMLDRETITKKMLQKVAIMWMITAGLDVDSFINTEMNYPQWKERLEKLLAQNDLLVVTER